MQAEDLSTSAGGSKLREDAACESSSAIHSTNSNEASVIVSTLSTKAAEASESADKNLEMRKDLLIQADEANATFQTIEVEGLFKNEPHAVDVCPVKEEDGVQQPSYVTLTPVSSGAETLDMADNASLVSNLSHLLNFNPTSWISGHEDTSLMATGFPQPVDLAPAHFQRNMVEVNGVTTELSTYLMDDEYKSPSMQIGPNPFYHMDTNNRRIWVPENCAAHRERNRSPGKSVLAGESIFVTEFESDVALHQQAVSIERFPNRSWRGPNSGKTQYEKGIKKNLKKK